MKFFVVDDFSISLLGYRTEFSCLYLPQGHTFINTDEYEHFWFWKSIFNMLFISRYHMPDLKYKIKFTSLVSFCTNSENKIKVFYGMYLFAKYHNWINTCIHVVFIFIQLFHNTWMWKSHHAIFNISLVCSRYGKSHT